MNQQNIEDGKQNENKSNLYSSSMMIYLHVTILPSFIEYSYRKKYSQSCTVKSSQMLFQGENAPLFSFPSTKSISFPKSNNATTRKESTAIINKTQNTFKQKSDSARRKSLSRYKNRLCSSTVFVYVNFKGDTTQSINKITIQQVQIRKENILALSYTEKKRDKVQKA